MTDSLIHLHGVTAGYESVPVIEDVSLEMPSGEFLGLVGPNGGGKSTLLRVVLGLLEPWAGEVSVLGRTPTRARRDIGYVPQYAMFSRRFPISVRDVVRTGRLGRTRPVFGYRRRDKAVVDWALSTVGVEGLAERPIGTLSGGQFQRALIARALACEPKLLILDEPTANVDPGAESHLFDLLAELNREMGIVVVSHDVGFISGYVHRVACLNRTLVCHTTAALTPEVIESLYGHPVSAVQHASEV
ncbi:ABC transporter ATP-binding protein [Ectothiorhodospiraceae bacterium WFHF3C12]|nr:ABC transporter ATP-binding protein [Ectothiorhodospiraceae bacterium WFHF3C12]